MSEESKYRLIEAAAPFVRIGIVVLGLLFIAGMLAGVVRYMSGGI